MLKIGISSCFMYPDKNRNVFGPKLLNYIESDMARYVAQKGILPILIPDVDDETLKDILEEMDGFIFQGGTDLAPESYNETPINNGQWKGDRYRDIYDLKVFDYAVKNHKPIFAICRGMQLMNVYFGGTLFQDTITQKENVLQHRDADTYDSLSHEVVFEGILKDLHPSGSAQYVNSVHHQSIKQLGNDLSVLARCPDDDIIEAIGYDKADPGKIIGVQWHPEFSDTLGSKVIDSKILLNHFFSFCK